MSFERSEDRAKAGRLVNVSRETWSRLDRLVEALDRWQAKTNLVAPSTLPFVWTRHVADSVQLSDLAPANVESWIDIGSGGGFPGLVIAALRPTTKVHLVESNLKKAAFLREAARAIEAAVSVHASRAEDVLGSEVAHADVVSARALASLDRLLGISAPLLKTGAIGLFPKGKDASSELTEAEKSWKFQASLHPSLTDSDARIVRVERFEGAR